MPLSAVTTTSVDQRPNEHVRVCATLNDRSVEVELRAIVIEAADRDRGSKVNLAEALRQCIAPLGGDSYRATRVLSPPHQTRDRE